MLSVCEARLSTWCADHCGRTNLIAAGQPKRCAPLPPLGGVPEGRFCNRSEIPFDESTELTQLAHACDKSRLPRTTDKSEKTLPCVKAARLDKAEALQLVRTARVALAFLVRDAAQYLERNVDALADLGREFRRFRMFFVENDSSDATRNILSRLLQKHQEALQGVMLDGAAAQTSFALCPPNAARRNCAARVQLLSFLRQRVLDLAFTWRWTCIIVVDIDFVSFSKPAFLRMFTLGRALNASAIFGQSMYKASRNELKPYDRGILPAVLQGRFSTMYRLSAQPRCALFNVQSAFGSFGIYFSPLPAAANYTRTSRQGRQYASRRSWTEHANFNLAIHEAQGHRRPLLLDPTFRPVYLYGSGAYWQYIKQQRWEPTSATGTVPQAQARARQHQKNASIFAAMQTWRYVDSKNEDPHIFEVKGGPRTWCPPTTLCAPATLLERKQPMDPHT
mmetsp:Transcript_19325/g.32316  ORF Transcript_19325/g.32316 Transcript_19325/m.32316 type:complete len:450 (+) Transcript_19325:8-1357(+)